MTSSTTPTGRATRREWIGLAVLALPCMLITMDQTVLYLAVPALTADLDPSASQVLWITDVYGFLIAGALVTMGTLGDRIGRRRLLLIGGAAFGAVSVLAAFSSSAGMLIAARALLGVAGRHAHAVHAVADPHDVRRPRPAHHRDRGVGGQPVGRRRGGSAARRRAAGACSGGARCSC